MDENQQFLQDVMEVALKILEESKEIIAKGQLLTKVGAYLRTLVDIRVGRSGAEKYKTTKPVLLIDNTNFGSNRTSFKEDDLMKNIRHRKDGRWEYRRMFDGEKFQFINKNREAVRKYAVAINKKIKSMMQGESDNNVTFYDYAVKFFNLYKSNKLAESTKSEYARAHQRFKEKFNKPFKSIKAEELQNFLNKEQIEHPTNALKMFNKIKAICKKAFLEGIISKNLGEIIERPDVRYGVRRALTLSEQTTFLQKIKSYPHDFQVYCLFCIVTSARREEAARLKPGHLNIEDGLLFINGTKTLNAPRTIRVTNEFINLIQSIGCKFQHTSDYYSKEAKEIFREMGSDDLTLNCLRHTCATNMVYLGIPSDYRKHIMGHSTVLTTDRVYTHIDPKVKKEDILNLYGNLYFTDF